MLSFLDLLGTIGAAVIGLPGILGVAAGMTTRIWVIAAGIGGAIGLVSPMVVGGAHSTYVPVTLTEYVVSVVVGLLAGVVGCAIRHKGATV